MLLLIEIICTKITQAQLPVCDRIYLKIYNTAPTLAIYTYDPGKTISSTNQQINTCSPPLSNSCIGLAIYPVFLTKVKFIYI